MLFFPEIFKAKPSSVSPSMMRYYVPWSFALDTELLKELNEHELLVFVSSERPLNRLLVVKREDISWSTIENEVLKPCAQRYVNQQSSHIKFQGVDGQLCLIEPESNSELKKVCVLSAAR